MGKLSSYGNDSSPALTDVVPTLKAGTSNRKSTLQSIISLFFATASIPTDYKNGWKSVSDTWAYSSYDSTNKTGVLTVPTDATAQYSAGMRVRFSQATGGTKYGIITAIAATTMTIYFGTDYSLANETVSSPCYSTEKAPLGFPLEPAKWTVTTTSANDRTTSSASYASLTDTLVVPIGSWDIRTRIPALVTVTATSSLAGAVTLSSDGSTETNPQLTGILRSRDASSAAASNAGTTLTPSSFVTVAVATTYTLMGKTNAGTLNIEGSSQLSIVLRAICAYL